MRSCFWSEMSPKAKGQSPEFNHVVELVEDAVIVMPMDEGTALSKVMVNAIWSSGICIEVDLGNMDSFS